MERRQYLTAVGALAATAATAGCSSDGDGTDDDPETTEDTPETTETTARTTTDGENHLAAAGQALQNAGQAIATESEKFSTGDFEAGVDVRVETITDYLDTATTELDAAESAASGDEADLIEAGRAWIAYARELTAFLDTLAEAFSGTGNGLRQFRAESFGRAAETLADVDDDYDDASAALVIVRDRAEDVDADALSGFDAVDAGLLEPTELDILESVLSALQSMSAGLRSLALGMEDFLTAARRLDNGRYTDAEAGFLDARDHFATGESTFRDAESGAPPEMAASMSELTCIAGALKDGSGHFATAAREYEAGNDGAAEQAVQDGQTALEQCESTPI